VTGYQVKISLDGATWQHASGTHYTFENLANGTSYAFQVRAVNSVGPGPAAAAAAVPSSSIAAPTAPQHRTVTPGNGKVSLRWTPPASDGGSLLIHYRVSKDGVVWTNTTNTSYTFENLTNGTSYAFQVRAVNSAGPGPAAVVAAAPSSLVTAPKAPRNFTATAGNGQVSLSWEIPENDGGSPVTGYRVSRDGTDSKITADTNYTFTGLTNGRKYTFQVEAGNSVGYSDPETADAIPFAAPSPPAPLPPSPTPIDPTDPTSQTVPTAPRNFTGTPGDGEVSLAWTAPADDGGSAVTGYSVSKDGENWESVTGAGYTFTGLTNGTEYTFHVKAVNSVGEGPAATVNATPNPVVATVPTAPRNFTGTPGDGRVSLSWTAPASDGGSPVTGYRVSKDGENWESVTGTSYTFTGLTNGTGYVFHVKAVNSVGEGPAAATGTLKPSPDGGGGQSSGGCDAAGLGLLSALTLTGRLLTNRRKRKPASVKR
jgi:titin